MSRFESYNNNSNKVELLQPTEQIPFKSKNAKNKNEDRTDNSSKNIITKEMKNTIKWIK